MLPYSAVIVGGCALHDGAYEEGLVAVDLLLAAHDAEAQAAGRAAPEHDVLAAVQVPGGDTQYKDTRHITSQRVAS